MTNDPWQAHELDILLTYFNSNVTILGICDRLARIDCHRSVDAVRNKLYDLRSKGGYAKPREIVDHNLRVGYLDIEASHLKANFGIILCWYIKVAGESKYYSSVITRKEIYGGKYDYRVVCELLNALQNFDVVYGHYAGDRRFDLPFIRTRALIHGLGEQLGKALDNRFIRDTWLISRNKLAMSSNRLEMLQHMLPGVESSKTAIKPATWIDAMYGNEKALKYVAEHCKADVDVLEQVHRALEPVEKKSYVRA